MRQLMYIALICTFLSACAAQKRVEDLTSNEKIPGVDMTKRLPNLPFQHSWVAPGADRSNYDGIYIKPINIDALKTANWESSASAIITSQQDYLREARDIAEHFRQELVMQLKASPKSPLKVVNSPGPGVAVMEISLVELEFSHPVARAAALAAPVPGTNAALSAFTEPHATFVMKIKDAQTGELLASLADRKFPPIRIVDLNKLTVTSSVREICSTWSEEIAETINKGKLAQVDERGRFTLMPW